MSDLTVFRGMRKIFYLVLTGLMALGGCATNPVTGKSELVLVSDAQERQIGEQQYGPSRQMQGGDYIVDTDLVRYVQTVGNRLAEKSDRQLAYEFNILNSSIPNAWALPGGKIAINRGLLLEMNTEAELAAVLGHELVHSAARHGAKGMERGMLLQGAVLASAVATRKSDYSSYAVGAASIAAQLINQKYGRGAELESDHYGMVYMSRAGYNPQGAVDLQKTFLRLSQGGSQNWLTGLFASHPPSQERVTKNEETLTELEQGGKIGRDEYQSAIARLKATKPAYETHDKGRKALSEGNPKKALQLARKAIRIEPEEALFYGLMGDADYVSKNYQQAVGHYTKALQRNDNYFKYYLGRGESYRKLKRLDLAESDLKVSAQLLPTADAMAGLGQIAENRGQIDQAISLYESAVASDTPAGRNSAERLVHLDLPRRPERYIAARIRMDQSGNVFIELGNRTSVPVKKVVVAIAYRDSAGGVQEEQRVHRATILGGKTALLKLGGQPYSSVLDTLQFAVRRAQVAR